jgi:excisionase family DNA binding protein
MSNTASIPSQFLTIQEAAAISRVSGRTIRRWIATHRLPYHQACPRSRVLIRQNDLTQFLTRHETTPQGLGSIVDEVLNTLVLR